MYHSGSEQCPQGPRTHISSFASDNWHHGARSGFASAPVFQLKAALAFQQIIKTLAIVTAMKPLTSCTSPDIFLRITSCCSIALRARGSVSISYLSILLIATIYWHFGRFCVGNRSIRFLVA